MFADWLEFASAFSIFLENEISFITRGNKQLNFLNQFRELFSANKAE